MRQCPFQGCGTAIPDSLFACGRHWRRVSREDRSVIYAAYGAYLDDQIGVEELRRIQGEVLQRADRMLTS